MVSPEESAADLLRRFSTSPGISEDFLCDIVCVCSQRDAAVSSVRLFIESAGLSL